MNEKQHASWRIKIGFALFFLSIFWVLILPVMPLLGFSASTIAAFTGVMVVLAEIMMLAGAAIAGKEGFAYIKSTIFGLFRQYGPPQNVSRTRYLIGLILFIVPILYGWAAPYAEHFIEGLEGYKLPLAIAGDVLLLTGLFVLGGEFWDKLRSLFIHGAHAVFPE